MSNAERLRRNEESRQYAEHDREPWGIEETQLLMELFPDAVGDPDEEMALAEVMGRTIEALRQRYYEVKAGRKPGGISKRTVTTTTTTTTTTHYRGLHDDDEDCWWDGSSAYYGKG